MARNPKATKKRTQGVRSRSSAASGRPRRGRPKFCRFCSEHATWVDYKDVGLLKWFVNDRGRIKARGATGTCAQHQRDVASAVKTARELALLPYAVRTAVTDTRGGRGGDRRKAGPAAQAAADSESDSAGSSAPADGESTDSSEETTLPEGAEAPDTASV